MYDQQSIAAHRTFAVAVLLVFRLIACGPSPLGGVPEALCEWIFGGHDCGTDHDSAHYLPNFAHAWTSTLLHLKARPCWYQLRSGHHWKRGAEYCKCELRYRPSPLTPKSAAFTSPVQPPVTCLCTAGAAPHTLSLSCMKRQHTSVILLCAQASTVPENLTFVSKLPNFYFPCQSGW